MGKLSAANAGDVIRDINFEYHHDFLALVTKFKVADRVDLPMLFGLCQSGGVTLSDFLRVPAAVKLFDEQLRAAIVEDCRTAEVIVRAMLDGDKRSPQTLPPSLTSEDTRQLLMEYIKIDDANMNTLQLIVGAKIARGSAIDKRVKVAAKRKLDAMTEELFRGNRGIKSGVSVELAPDQDEPVVEELDGHVVNYSYGRKWLEDDLSYPTILNNFAHLFKFADRRMTLALPAYPADLGVFERFMGVRGKDDYITGVVFNLQERGSLLQTMMYDRFLRLHDIELESVLRWFFVEYIPQEFDAPSIIFTPSSASATFLERNRHLFSEMEGVLAQFTLFVEDGIIDMDLLAIGSEQVDYRSIPSLVQQKYAYVEPTSDLATIVNLLYSDQSSLTYINDSLKDKDAASLVLSHVVSYSDYLEYQKPLIDYLIKHDIFADDGKKIKFKRLGSARLLKELFSTNVISYGHATDVERALVDEMVAKGWLSLESTLLAKPEADYFNFMLNQKSFGNGPDLRNKYTHASIANPNDEVAHSNAYITVLVLLIALVIKINDDYCLRFPASGTEGE